MSEDAWHFYLDDMSSFANDALNYSRGLSLAEFEQNSMAYDATLRKIELIGEAAGNIPVDIRALAPLIPWREIIATRNRVAHAYLGIDNDTIWSILQDELPALIKEIAALQQRLKAADQPTDIL